MDSTMFDFSDFYESIAKLMPSPCIVVEVGVASGDSALFLAKKLNELNKDFKLYMVDNLDYGGVLQLKQIYENIIKSGLGERIEVIPTGSIKAAKMFNGGSINFCFIDSSHEYNMTKKEAKAWYEKVKDDGIISGHDMLSDENPGVGKAIYELFPFTITRKTIDEPGHYQEFEPEPFLNIEKTTRNLGVWWCRKKFYFSPK